MSDRYDRMDTGELLREMCRKLDAIEKQGAPVKVTATIEPWSRDGYEAALASHREGCALSAAHVGGCADLLGDYLGHPLGRSRAY